MAFFCPKPCGRLATAAVFIVVGVVQLLVGVILLRSKYADLLSGADFLTSATNILVGCLYGTAASVWQSNTKRITPIRTAKKNTLAALLISVITVNTTAVIILIMCDGNKLLSLPFFNDRSEHSSATFAKEVFASAYVTSVCSPIVCLVIALVALSGNCFQMYGTHKDPTGNEKIKNPFGWVFEEKSQTGPKVISNITKTSSESSTSENSVFSTNSDSCSSKRKSVLSVKNIASPLHTWKQKRAKILRNDSLSRKCAPFDARFQNSNYMDGLQEGLIPRMKDSSLKNPVKNVTTIDDASKLEEIGRSSTVNKMSNIGFYHCSNGTDFKKVRSDSYVNAILEENMINYEPKLERKCASMVNKGANAAEDGSYEQKYCHRSKSPEHFRSAHSSVGNLKSSYASVHKSPLRSSNVYIGEVTGIQDPEMTRLKLQTLQELKKRVRNNFPGSKITILRSRENEDFEVPHMEKTDFKSSIHEQSPREIPERSSHSNEILSPGEVFEPRENSEEAIEYLHRNELSSLPSVSRSYSPLYSKPLDLTIREKIKTEMKEIKVMQLNAINHSPSKIITKNKFQISSGEIHSYDEGKLVQTEQDYSNIAFSKLQNKKREMSRKIASMASIAEVPSEEGFVGNCLDHGPLCHYSNRTVSLGESSRDIDENSNITSHSSLSRAFSENPVLKKSRNFSPKGILKKMWSSAGPETNLNVSDLIVDEDTLIGLSDEELLARTLRIRSLRKVVEERSKEGNKMKNKMVD